jgi:acetyl esterase/lipase
LTPLRGAQRFCDSVRAGGGVCELVVYPGVGHLLTRNLANQESDFDPDPAAREDGNSRQQEFVRALWRKQE